MKLHDIVTSALSRLDDERADTWSRTELGDRARDGYNAFARRTSCIYDIVVIENLPPTGGFGSDLQQFLAGVTPGHVVHDRRILFTQPGERDLIREPIEGVDVPITATVADQASGRVSGGKLPTSVVSVLRVAWDRATLARDSTQLLRLRDYQFETRDGDPQTWMWAEDGLLSLRIWPAAQGDATYDTIDTTGSHPWGHETQSDDGVTEDLGPGLPQGYGIISGETDAFPSGGPWGLANRLHPDLKNIKIEITRLGRDPEVYPLEIPRVFEKYVIFYAMSEALKREGPGQDLKLAKHYMDRFELGVARMQARLKHISREKVGSIGGGRGAAGELRFSLPSWWGYVRPVR
jgi:hypothetical protein